MSGAEQQLAEATQKIEELERSLKAAQDELQFFVYAASHDLQQPLRAISTHAQLLQREFANEKRAAEFTAVIAEGVAQANGLITDLLTFSRSGNTARLTSFKMSSALQWALFNLAKAIESSGAQVTSGELPEVIADEKQMVTIFENLVGNSLKFKGSGPPKIEITGETDERSHIISVADNGCGIKSEHQQIVFEPFKRLHGKEVPGSGLGLAVCRKIMRAHQGRIWIESDGQSGTTVKFSLPL